MKIATNCKVCGKKFEKHVEETSEQSDRSQDICYKCALESLTKGQPPEEGDFNTAMIISGEMSDDERRLLMEDLRAVEEGRSIVEHHDGTDKEQQDPAWCYTCNRDTAFCTCILCPKCGEYHEDCQC